MFDAFLKANYRIAAMLYLAPSRGNCHDLEVINFVWRARILSAAGVP
jgi:hypothetical protein